LKASPLHDDRGQAKEWLDFIKANPLPECVRFYDYDHISMMFNGTARVESTSNGGDDEKPRKRQALPVDDEEAPPRKRTAPVDDDGEVERPVRRRGREADPDDDDGAAEVAPPRRRAAPVDEEPPFEPDERPRRGRQAITEPEDDLETDVDPKPRSSIRDRLKSRRSPDPDDD
jgi:hypothetical protein